MESWRPWPSGRVSSHRVFLGFGATSLWTCGARVMSPRRRAVHTAARPPPRDSSWVVPDERPGARQMARAPWARAAAEECPSVMSTWGTASGCRAQTRVPRLTRCGRAESEYVANRFHASASTGGYDQRRVGSMRATRPGRLRRTGRGPPLRPVPSHRPLATRGSVAASPLSDVMVGRPGDPGPAVGRTHATRRAARAGGAPPLARRLAERAQARRSMADPQESAIESIPRQEPRKKAPHP